MTKKREFTEADRAIVRRLTALGFNQVTVAAAVGCSRPTLRKHCQAELDAGMAQIRAELALTALRMACSGLHPALTIFLCKTHLGWRERDSEESGTLHVVINDDGLQGAAQ